MYMCNKTTYIGYTGEILLLKFFAIMRSAET